MSDYKEMANVQKSWMLVIITIIAVLAIFSTKQPLFYGLLLGTCISFFNLWLLHKKMQVFAESTRTEGFKKGFGTISRFAAAVLGIIIAIRYDLSIIGYIIGLVTAYPIIMLSYLYVNKK